MPTYQEYQEQILKLQALAEKARQDEVDEARRKVRELMRQYNFNRTDLLGAASTKKRKPGPKKGTAKPKYRDPESGVTWSGRGRIPLWLNGRIKDDFLIK